MVYQRAFRLWGIGGLSCVGLIIACSVSSGTLPGGGSFVNLTIAGRTFTFLLGTVGQFELSSDGSAVQKKAVIPLFDDVPADTPGSGDLHIDRDTIQAIPFAVSKAQPNAQAITGSADVVVRIGSATSTDPCVDGIFVGTFHLTFADGEVSMDQTSLQLSPEALAYVITGRFTICLEVTANVDAMLIIGEMSFIFGPPVEPDDHDDGGGDDDDEGGDDEDGGDDDEGGDIAVSIVQVTFDPANDTSPKWDPGSQTIAFTTDRAPAVPTSTEPVLNVGYVQANGSNEGNMAVGPNSPFGVGGPMFWVGTTGQLLVNERVVFHEYMTFDAGQAPFTRTINDGDDAAFTRKLVIPGGGGGDFITVSRDGSTVIWLIRSTTAVESSALRFGEFSSLTGQNADTVGSVLFTYQDWAVGGLGGVALVPDGSQLVISLPSGNGRDLFLYTTSSPPTLVRQLTTSGETSGVDNVHPGISPGGTLVAFAVALPEEDAHLYTIGLDGADLTQLTSGGENESAPSWSPDGERIAFQRLDDDNWDIYVLTLGEGGCVGDNDCPDGLVCVAGVCVHDDDSGEGETGTVTGSVVDAQTGEALAGVLIQVSGTGLSATTDASGNFTILNVPAGAATLVASLADYVETTVPVLVLPNITAETSIGMLAIGAGGDNVAVVLAWGENPRDLDLHMSGPDGADGRFHIAYYAREPVDFAFLDLDDTTSFGPETITVSPQDDGNFVAGDYQVWIHHFSGQLTFAESSGTITLFAGGAQIAQYSVGSASGDGSERIWQVVEFSVSESGAVSNVTVLQSFVAGSSSSVF